MTKKHLFRQLQIKVRPKGLHSFTFSTLNFKFSSTTVEESLQIRLFMQNKAKFRKSQMNVNNYITRDYEKRTLGEHGKKQSQTNPNEPNLLNAQMNVNEVLTKDYENKSPIRAPKKQSQISKRQKPMQTSLPKRIMKKTAFSGPEKTNPNKPNFRGKNAAAYDD